MGRGVGGGLGDSGTRGGGRAPGRRAFVAMAGLRGGPARGADVVGIGGAGGTVATRAAALNVGHGFGGLHVGRREA